MKLNVGCMTYRGDTRENNQDAVVLCSVGKNGQYFVVLAVCDGVGGLEHGELASSLAVQRIQEWYDCVLQWINVETMEPDLLYSHLKDLAEECNGLIREYQVLHQIQTGTTMTLMMILREFYYIVQVGDSRVYQYRKGQLMQITQDASVTKIKNGKMKTYLDNYLGKQEPLWFTCVTGIIRKDDIFVVCTDGLYHHLKPEDIQQFEKEIHKAKKISDVCRQLIKRMMERGERDNISVGLIAVK